MVFSSVLALVSAVSTGQLLTTAPVLPVPFSNYPASRALFRKPATPALVTAEQKRFRSVLLNAVVHGWGVVDGETEHERPGANFDGHYLLVQWGCGSNCMQAALIDGYNGHVTALPHPSRSDVAGFEIGTGSADLRTLEFRHDSSLLGMPEIADGYTYYYRLSGNTWHLLFRRKTLDGHN